MNTQKTILVTGGCGFIGSNFVTMLIEEHPEFKVINLDSLTYAGNLENLEDIMDEPQYEFIRGDICDENLVSKILSENKVDGIINFAAESHVDRSISGPKVFVDTNITGTLVLLQQAVANKTKRFLQVSTDEVYGSLGDDGEFTEESPIKPNSPYSVSKASADYFVQAYQHTYGLETIITRCSNNYGRYQFPEKLIPLMFNNARTNKKLPVYGDGKNVRDWIHVYDHCRAILLAYSMGESGNIYNVGADCEKTNLEIINLILTYLGKPESLIEFVKDRLGHDQRYAIDSSKIRNTLGWKPTVDFDSGIIKTLSWYYNNKDWVDNVTSGEYKNYYSEMYENR